MTQWDVYVEGESDQQFLTCMARHLQVDGLVFQTIGTNLHGLKKMTPQLRRSHDAGKHVAVVFDANSDPKSQQRKLQRIIDEIGVPVLKSFLLPDDKRPGCLETLLEAISAAPHGAIYDCFDAYEKCLRDVDRNYPLPDKKARVYAYCQAIGSETRPGKRDYCNSGHWDLTHRCSGRSGSFFARSGPDPVASASTPTATRARPRSRLDPQSRTPPASLRGVQRLDRRPRFVHRLPASF